MGVWESRAYCLGVVIVIIFFVLFGVSSLIVLPFSDLCEGMPVTNEDPQSWLLTFSSTSPSPTAPLLGRFALLQTPLSLTTRSADRITDVDPLLAGLYTDCLVLTNTDGSLWSVAGQARSNLSAKLEPYDVQPRISSETVTALLDAAANSASFTAARAEMEADMADRGRLQVRLSAASLAALASNGTNANGTNASQRATDWAAYTADVDSRLALTAAHLASATQAQAALLAASAALQQNLTRMVCPSPAPPLAAVCLD